MEPKDWIALVAVVVGPVSALAGAYVNATLARRSKSADAESAARGQALEGLARMRSLLIDAEPSLILNNQLREYSTPAKAVDGLYNRWLKAREPLMLLNVTHPLPEVRELAFRLAAGVEKLLRAVDLHLESGGGESAPDLRVEYQMATESAMKLGRLLSPFET